MDDAFDGFPPQDKLTAIPESFFSEVLPQVNDLAELKLVLFFMWAVQQREGDYRYLSEADLRAAEPLTAALRAARPDADPADTLVDALRRATERGVLLSETVQLVDERPQTLYFMNTKRGRDSQLAVQQGRYRVGEALEILPPRPNIYRLYEQEIGPITPMIADGLKDLEASYPATWLPEAVRIAAENQAKHLKFIRAVLERWRKEGKSEHEITGRHGSVGHSGDGRQRFGGKYADWLNT